MPSSVFNNFLCQHSPFFYFKTISCMLTRHIIKFSNQFYFKWWMVSAHSREKVMCKQKRTKKSFQRIENYANRSSSRTTMGEKKWFINLQWEKKINFSFSFNIHRKKFFLENKLNIFVCARDREAAKYTNICE